MLSGIRRRKSYILTERIENMEIIELFQKAFAANATELQKYLIKIHNLMTILFAFLY